MLSTKFVSFFLFFFLPDQQLMFNTSVIIQMMSSLLNKVTVQIFISGSQEERNARARAADPDATCGRQRSGASDGGAAKGCGWSRAGIRRATGGRIRRPSSSGAGRSSKRGTHTPKLHEVAGDRLKWAPSETAAAQRTPTLLSCSTTKPEPEVAGWALLDYRIV